MNRTVLYLINVSLTSIIGAIIEILHTLLEHKSSINLWELFGSMGKAILIGTICLFIFIHLLVRMRKKPIIGYITCFTMVAALLGMLFAYDLIIIPDAIDYFRWVIAFATAEILGITLTILWYKWVKTYNNRLEKKKASIID